jgi:hypothetical protein
MSHPEFSDTGRFGMLSFEETEEPLVLYGYLTTPNNKGLMFIEQFQVGDAMVTKVIWFASSFKKSIHPGLSR